MSYNPDEEEVSDRHEIEESYEQQDEKYIEPEVESTGLKRRSKGNPSRWKANIRKRMLLSGKAHINTAGKVVPEKCPKPMGNHACNMSCLEFTEEDRLSVCRGYWDLADRQLQMSWILSNVTESPAKTHKADVKQMKCRHRFFLPIKEEDRRVCRKFFCDTLHISYNTILEAHKHRSDHGVYSHTDARGRHKWSKRALSEAEKEFLLNQNFYNSISSAIVVDHQVEGEINDDGKRYSERKGEIS